MGVKTVCIGWHPVDDQGWTKWWSQWSPITESFNFWRKVLLEFYAFLFTFWRKESICDRNKHIVTNHLTIISMHCFYRQPGEGIQIGPNWDLSKALNNRYRLLLLRIDRYPGHFGVLLIKIHLLAFVVVAIKWIIRPKTKKNLFSWSLHLNAARNSSVCICPAKIA